jgi:glyoxylate utilization-related uncharacterized protein
MVQYGTAPSTRLHCFVQLAGLPFRNILFAITPLFLLFKMMARTSSGAQPTSGILQSYEETFIILDGEIEVIVDEQTERIGGGKIAIIPANTWHEFKNRSDKPLLMVNLHPVPKMITEWG